MAEMIGSLSMLGCFIAKPPSINGLPKQACNQEPEGTRRVQQALARIVRQNRRIWFCGHINHQSGGTQHGIEGSNTEGRA
jgi:hypothetical protein